MANAGTLKLGCAYSRCTSNPNSPFVSLVCQYGEKHVSMQTPLYNQGKPCEACEGKCYDLFKLCIKDD
ncbi:hypothetical protein KIN20_011315 [Parelaphostrongylus tenuis]|nr:hypothetical protein KIN20_011315 [Parelaphostrongylus tenuis]